MKFLFARFAACAACAAVGLATVLQAATAFLDGTTLRYHAGGGEANAVTFNLVGSDLVIHDPGALIATNPGDGFTFISPNEVSLPLAAVSALEVRLQDLDDSCVVSAALTLPATIQGDEGDDTITGGSGDDVIRGGLGNNTEDGGAGYDTLVVNVDGFAGVSNGNELNTSDGQRNAFFNFELINIRGGPSNDIIDVRGMPASAAFDIEGNDGDDNLTVAGGDGVARGGSGSDRFFVLGTTDMVVTDTHVTFDIPFAGTKTASFLTVESITILDNDDGHTIDASSTSGVMPLAIEGNGGPDYIVGGAGDDAIRGGEGSNTINGGLGDDILIVNVDGSALLTDTMITADYGGQTEQDEIVNIERVNLRGGPNDDFFDASETTGQFLMLLEGNDGRDTFVTGSNGRVGMYGKSGDDTYYIGENWGEAGIIEADGNDLLHFGGWAPFATDLTVTLSAAGLSSATSGISFINFSSGPAIEKVIGGTGENTLVGADQANTWQIDQINHGIVGPMTFSDFGNLTGGNVDDIFVFGVRGRLSGAIDGRTGHDVLDESAVSPHLAISGPGSLDGGAGTAANLGSGFDNLEAILGNAPCESPALRLMVGDGMGANNFGNRVAISGDTAVVAAIGDSDNGFLSGAVFVFERDPSGSGVWALARKLTPMDALPEDRFGGSVSLDGDLIVVGAFAKSDQENLAGAVYLFARNEGGPNMWGQVRRLNPEASSESSFFCSAVSISGDTLAVGASGDDSAGAGAGSVYVFSKDQAGAGQWGLVKKILASDAVPSGSLGGAVSLNEDTLAAWAREGDGLGQVYVHMRDFGGFDQWGEQAILHPSATHPSGYFDHKLALHEDTLVIGGAKDDGNGEIPAVFVHHRHAGGADAWQGTGELDLGIAGFDPKTTFANGDMSVGISGNLIAVGLPTSFQTAGDDVVGTDTFNGEVHLFSGDASTPGPWTHTRIILSPTATDPQLFGAALGLDGGSLLVGALQSFAPNHTGSAYLFDVSQCGLVANQPPVATCPPPLSAEATSPAGATVALTANVNDPDGDALTVVWSVDGNIVQTDNLTAGTAHTPVAISLTATFGLGAHDVSVSVSDGTAAPVSCTTTVTVQDTTPPVIACPPEIQVVSLEDIPPADFAGGSASDAVSAVTVTHVGDSAFSGSCGGVMLRTYRAMDASGNFAECSQAIVLVTQLVFDDERANVRYHDGQADGASPENKGYSRAGVRGKLRFCEPGLLPDDLLANPSAPTVAARVRAVLQGRVIADVPVTLNVMDGPREKWEFEAGPSGPVKSLKIHWKKALKFSSATSNPGSPKVVSQFIGDSSTDLRYEAKPGSYTTTFPEGISITVASGKITAVTGLDPDDYDVSPNQKRVDLTVPYRLVPGLQIVTAGSINDTITVTTDVNFTPAEATFALKLRAGGLAEIPLFGDEPNTLNYEIRLATGSGDNTAANRSTVGEAPKAWDSDMDNRKLYRDDEEE